MPAHYRTASRADLPDIVSLYNRTIPSRQVTADLEAVTVESREAWFLAHEADRRPIWVIDRTASATSASGLAAWLSFSDFHQRPAYAGTAELSLYVHEDCRRQGWGAYLLAEAEKAAPTFGIHSLVGLIFAHNQPSLRLFTRAGFMQWAHMPRIAQMDGQRYDLVIVGKTLA